MDISTPSDKTLFTPGPLTTSRTVKQAMLRDLGSRDTEFIDTVADVRHRLVALAGASPDAFAAIPMQGSGTFALESVLATTVPPGGALLIGINGAYGRRLAQMAELLSIPVRTVDYVESEPIRAADIEAALREDDAISHVSVCHCETTSGIVNPVREIGAAVREAGRRFFVDAMSSFGAVPLDVEACGVDYLVSSSNKCIEGVPGFGFVIARLEALLNADHPPRSLSLDLLGQHRGLEANGQFRFTPPTHAILALHQALLELEAEGGVAGRAARYTENHHILTAGMRRLGFREYLAPELQGPIITSFHTPGHPRFSFVEFYRRLSDAGCVIYPGKVGDADCFRIGSIGRLFPRDMRNLLAAVERVLDEMAVDLTGGD